MRKEPSYEYQMRLPTFSYICNFEMSKIELKEI